MSRDDGRHLSPPGGVQDKGVCGVGGSSDRRHVGGGSGHDQIQNDCHGHGHGCGGVAGNCAGLSVEGPSARGAAEGGLDPRAPAKRQTGGGRRVEYDVLGLDCADCARRLEQTLRSTPGVGHAVVSYPASRVLLVGAGEDALQTAESRARELGFTLTRGSGARPGPSPRLLLTLASGVLLVSGWLARGGAPAAANWLYYAASVIGGLMILRGAVVSARDRTLTVDVLVALAVVTALATGEALAAAEVVVLMGVGHALEDRTLDRTRRSVRGLLELAPKTAWVRRDGREHEVQRDELLPGDLVVVRPGARVPVDGIVVEGLAEVSEAPITGEARLRTKAPGDEVFAGSLAQYGAMVFRAEHVGPDTTLARMAALVDDAQMRQAPVARQVDRFAAVFIPVTLAVAGLVLLATRDPRRAVTILIGACPCALVLSTPVAVYAAIGAASRRGLLVKGGIHLERLGRVGIAALDKSGTLTRGELEVTAVAGPGAPERLLALAASAETLSEHSVGKAIVRAAAGRGLPVLRADGFEPVPGAGVRAAVDGETVLVGTPRWVTELGVTIPPEVNEALRSAEASGLTAVVVAQAGVGKGAIILSDRLRPDAATAVAGLRRLGMRVVLLSGDAPAAVSRIAAGLDIKEFHGGLMPAEKAGVVARLSKTCGTVMVGDGINDAPALAAASVGVAVGRSGNDLAIEAADVVLLADDLTRLPELLRIGRLALSNIRANLALSGLAIAGLMAAATFGFIGPAAGALIHEGSAMLVILNAMRLLRLGAQEPFGCGAEVGAHEARAVGTITAGN